MGGGASFGYFRQNILAIALKVAQNTWIIVAVSGGILPSQSSHYYYRKRIPNAHQITAGSGGTVFFCLNLSLVNVFERLQTVRLVFCLGRLSIRCSGSD